jgi:hypothetical protein
VGFRSRFIHAVIPDSRRIVRKNHMSQRVLLLQFVCQLYQNCLEWHGKDSQETSTLSRCIEILETELGEIQRALSATDSPVSCDARTWSDRRQHHKVQVGQPKSSFQDQASARAVLTEET